MKFGVFSTNSGDGPHTQAAASWEEDLRAIVTAERLGFEEAWVAEHVGPKRATTMCVADHLICKAAALTKDMRLGPAVRPLPLYHPYQVAMEAAACDHLTGGRYMAGFGGAGQALRQFPERGLAADPSESRAMMHEAVDYILRCWTEPEPFDFEGRFWQGRNISVLPKPLQQPHMPVGFAVSESLSSAELAGRNGFMPLTHYHNATWSLRELAAGFVAAANAAGHADPRSRIRVCRFVHISDSVKQGKAEIRADLTPMIERQKVTLPWQFKNSMPASGRIEDVTFDYLVDSGIYFVGDADTVYKRIRDEYDEIGGYGALLLVTKEVGTERQRLRSWRLFTKHVASLLGDLDPDHPAPQEAAS